MLRMPRQLPPSCSLCALLCACLRSPLCSTRYGGCEPHTIAAYVGGVASQEALKLITGLFVPIGNTHVFNGIAAVGAMYLL
ncbi:hypothetical protein EON67_08770 [archaeon]|nr:MAG: hypothetical protein EON67_08770 [archaeon]